MRQELTNINLVFLKKIDHSFSVSKCINTAELQVAFTLQKMLYSEKSVDLSLFAVLNHLVNMSSENKVNGIHIMTAIN